MEGATVLELAQYDAIGGARAVRVSMCVGMAAITCGSAISDSSRSDALLRTVYALRKRASKMSARITDRGCK